MGNKGVNPRCPQCGKHGLCAVPETGLKYCALCGWQERKGTPRNRRAYEERGRK
jgi:uncharacterized protein (DUF983 family)